MLQGGYIYKLTLLRDIDSFKAGEVYIGQHIGINTKYFSSGLLVNRIVGKYTETVFSRDLIVTNIFDLELLDLLEIYWICFYDCNRYRSKFGLNLTDGGDCGTTRMVSCFNNKGELIKVYDSITAAAEDNNVNVSYITRQCRGNKVYSTKGIRFRYYDKDVSSIAACPIKLRTSKWRIIQKDKQGNFIKEFSSIGLAALETNINSNMIASCLYCLSKEAGGYIWEKLEKVKN